MRFITIEQKLKDLLFNPDLFFSEKLKNEVSLKYPILIMLVDSIFLALISSFAPRGRSLLSIFENGILGGYGGWIILTVVFYLVSLIFKPDGSFTRTLEFVSYGFLPGIFAGVVNLIVHFILRNSFNMSPINPRLNLEYQIQLIIHNPILQASTIIGFLCILWTVYIFMFALAHALNLSKRNAIITVSVPYVFIFTLLLIGLHFMTTYSNVHS